MEGVARGRKAVAVRVEPRIDRIIRILGVVEVKGPVQESLQVELVQLRAEDARARAGHGDEYVRDVHALSNAVISPQVGNSALEERLDVIRGGHGMLHRAAVVKRGIAQRVDDRTAAKMLLHQRLCGEVVRQVVGARLIGDVEDRAVGDAERLELIQQRRKVSVEERGVLRARGGRMPAEDALHAVFSSRDDLRRELRAPLREQVGDFVVLYAAAAAHVHPPAQPAEAKAVAVCLAEYIHQLHRRAVGAHARVQRRRVRGHEDGVDAVLDRAAHEVFRNAPVFLGKDLDAVVVGEGVRVQPAGVDQRLLRQLCADQFERDLDFAGQRAALLVDQADVRGVFARVKLIFRREVKPDCAPLPRQRAQPVRGDLDQRVGIQAGLLAG